ncbi:hypothetical protein J4412_00625 [Candidatus Pacearchaeota archaeon]|nr:MAG: hypothetical protein QJ16_C0006G0013 [archaeon GW2011_AR1]MBS3077994.1 hypothetical protein [Candidatus Pacearchaeota archaeon]HIH52217.1 hypothetical protein [Nanoarchaeota archaeon]
MKNKTNVGILAVFTVLVLGVAGIVSAGGFGMGINSGNSTQNQEFQTQVHNAVTSGDFSTWKSLMESRLTQANFDSIQARARTMSEFRTQMEDARDFGNYTLMQQLREQYGVGNKGQGNGMARGNGQEIGLRIHQIQ